MYLADYHSHTSISPDSPTPIRVMVESAIAHGVKELCITDHCDLLTEHGERATLWDWAPSVQQFEEIAPTVQDKITLRLGLELGMPHLDIPQSADICAHPKLDFVIGSIHNLSPAMGGDDFYFMDFPDEATCYRTLDDYFTSMEEMVATDYYDVIGHVIYPLRYMIPGITLERYWPQIEGIFKTTIAKGKGMEINTYRGKSIEEWRSLLTLYKDCGGTIVTVGADAHVEDMVGAGVAEAYALLKEVGFTHICAEDRGEEAGQRTRKAQARAKGDGDDSRANNDSRASSGARVSRPSTRVCETISRHDPSQNED